MEVHRVPRADEFLRLTERFRDAEPVLTNVIGSVALSVANATRTYDDEFWWVVTNDSVVVGAAMRTPPHGLMLAPCINGASALLATAIYDVDADLPAVAGPRDAVEEFLLEWQQYVHPRSFEMTLLENIQTIHTLITPQVNGTSRLAHDADREILRRWGRIFSVDAHLPHWSDDGLLLSLDEERLYVWEINGSLVSMAGHATPVTTSTSSVARVGPVFTPHDQRGFGYAAGITAAVTSKLMTDGHLVMLHTDAKNSTSNGVYGRLGYSIIGQNVRYECGE